MIERFVDYVQASQSLSELDFIANGAMPVPPVKFYKRGYQKPNGFRVYFGNPNSKKAMVVASGAALQSLRNDFWTDAEILDELLTKGAEISRLDLAVTEWLEDDLLTLEDVETWVTEGLIEASGLSTQSKTISSLAFGGQKHLETLYVGDISKRGKQGLFRAYDKGLELNIGAYLSTRLELELKREKAQNTAKRLAKTGEIAGNFRTFFNVRSENFERVMDAPAVSNARGKNLIKEEEIEAINRRWDWLIEQVAPALKQAISDERSAGNGNKRLSKFLERSGLGAEMREQIVASANKMHDNYLQSIGVKGGKFNGLELD